MYFLTVNATKVEYLSESGKITSPDEKEKLLIHIFFPERMKKTTKLVYESKSKSRKDLMNEYDIWLNDNQEDDWNYEEHILNTF